MRHYLFKGMLRPVEEHHGMAFHRLELLEWLLLKPLEYLTRAQRQSH